MEERLEEEKLKNRRNARKYVTLNKGQKPKKDYSLIKDIREQKLIKANVGVRDKVARKYLTENYETKGPNSILPGQLVMFNYFNPITKEDLARSITKIRRMGKR